MAPSKILKRMVPAYSVCNNVNINVMVNIETVSLPVLEIPKRCVDGILLY